jgi:hypothetical protein
MLSEFDRNWRRAGIGGSDARAIASGVPAQWKALRLEKLGIVEPMFDKQQQLLMAMGSALEAVALDYVDANIEKVVRRGIQTMWSSDEYFRCTLDGLTLSTTPVQCKFHSGDKTIDDLVDYYWPQLQHELLVTGSGELMFAVLFGHYGRFVSETVLRDAEFIAAYQLRCFEFKHYVATNQLPADMAAAVEADGPGSSVGAVKQNVPRLRDHVWPADDNEIAAAATSWIDNRQPSIDFDAATTTLKEKVPDDARSATWLRNGIGVKVNVNKRGAKSVQLAVGTPTLRL